MLEQLPVEAKKTTFSWVCSCISLYEYYLSIFSSSQSLCFSPIFHDSGIISSPSLQPNIAPATQALLSASPPWHRSIINYSPALLQKRRHCCLPSFPDTEVTSVAEKHCFRNRHCRWHSLPDAEVTSTTVKHCFRNTDIAVSIPSPTKT